MTHVAPAPRPKFCGAPARRIFGVGSDPCALAGRSARFWANIRGAFEHSRRRKFRRPLRKRISTGRLAGSGFVGGLPCALRACPSAHLFAALPGRILRAEALPVRRSPSEHCRRPGRRVLLAARQTRAHRRASDCGRRREMLSRRCSGDLGRALPDAERSLNFPVFPERWRKRHAANESHPLPGRGNGRSAEDPVFRTPDIYAKASAFVRISPCAWRRAPVPWWR